MVSTNGICYTLVSVLYKVYLMVISILILFFSRFCGCFSERLGKPWIYTTKPSPKIGQKLWFALKATNWEKRNVQQKFPSTTISSLQYSSGYSNLIFIMYILLVVINQREAGRLINCENDMKHLSMTIG